MNLKGFEYLANTVDNLIGMTKELTVSQKTEHDALELKERFFQHGMQRLSGGIDAIFSTEEKLYEVKKGSFTIQYRKVNVANINQKKNLKFEID